MWADEKYWRSGVNCDGLVTLNDQNCSDMHDMPELYVFNSTKGGSDSLPKGKPKLLDYEYDKIPKAEDLKKNIDGVATPFNAKESAWWDKLYESYEKVKYSSN